jgi:hypothetical protein
MSLWPNARKPVSNDEQVFGQYDEADLHLMQEAAADDKADGHMATPVLVELKDGDKLRYTVIDGPRCDHTCAKCQSDMVELRAEFGTGAIGAFTESSGGEMEKLRRELGELARTLQRTLAPISQRLDQIEAAQAEARLPVEKTLVEKT